MRRACKTGVIVFMVLTMVIGFSACGFGGRNVPIHPANPMHNISGEITFSA